jgi:hypothetical protein
MRASWMVRIVVGVIPLLAAAAPALAQKPVKVGHELPYETATPRDYPRGGADRPVV